MILILFALWIILNGRWTTEIALFGAGVSALLYAFCCAFLGFSPQKEWKLLQKLPAALKYARLLLKQIVISNLGMIRIVYGHRSEIAPKLVTFETPLKGSAKTILANSITMTPGTITVENEPQSNTLTVHCLNSALAEGIENTEFQQALLDMTQKEDQK